MGFGHQLIKALIPPPPEGSDAPQAQPGALMETDWMPKMMQLVGLARDHLPVIRDADFLYGPEHAAGEETYVLCEINVGSVFPVSDDAPDAIAEDAAERLKARRAPS